MTSLQSSGRNRSGFTLIELIISAVLMTMILVSAYVCLNAAFSSQKMIEPRVLMPDAHWRSSSKI